MAAAFGLGCFAWAAGETIPMLLPGERVEGSLAATGERKTIAYAGVEGSTLDLGAKALGASRVVPTITLLAPDGTEVDLGATNPKSTGRARARRIALGATGIWRIGVTTPANAGGDFELSTTAKVPLKFSWKASQADAAAFTDHFVPAAPGGVIAVSVTAKGKPSFDPTVELIAPSGRSITTVVGFAGKATIPVARLDELGRYTVRVTGGPGPFSARATVKPAKKRAPTYRDVEAPPEIRSFTPTTTTNDALVRFELDGFAFSTKQTVAIVAGASTQAAGPVKQITPAGAAADFDLSGVPPGTYDILVVTPEGNSATAPGKLLVTNRVPGINSMTPTEVSNKDPYTLDLRGAGFDSTATVSLRRTADALAIPVTVQTRTSHTTIFARVSPPAYVTGPCDLEIRDPDGSKVTIAGGVDLLGFRAPPAAVRQLSAVDAWQSFFPRDSAYDATNGRVLVAVQERNTVAFTLFDATTLAVADSMVLSVADLGISGKIVRPRIAWDRVTGTFALGLTAGSSGQAYAFVRVVSATDLQDTKLQTNLAWAMSAVTQVTPASNGDDGGYVVVWEQYEGAANGAKIKAQVITPQLTANTSAQPVIVSHPLGYLWEPVIAYQGNRRFVVAWAGAANNDANWAVYATVVNAAGISTGDGPYVTATSAAWNDLFQPEITPNPSDGSMLLAFTYSDASAYRPGVQRLAPVTANPGPYSALDGSGLLPEGYIDSVRWNPARSEFVATMTNVGDRVAVRRVNPDGTIRASPVLESYEGIWGILYAGPEAGQLGLVRGFDGTADDIHFGGTDVMQALAGPLR